MKKMKRIMALMLAAIMMMAMSVTTFAAGTTCSLTVNAKGGQDLKGQTINLYKLFDVTESGEAPNKNYAYTVNTASGYKDALVSVLGSPITVSSTDEDIANAVRNIGSSDSKEVQDFANAFTTKALTTSPKLEATAKSEKLGDVTSYTFNGLAAGYYLVYVTGGKEIQSSLVTVDSASNTVNLKTEAPSITKTADKDTVSIGQVVKYTVTGSIPDTTGYDQYQYIIHDELSKGLDFVNDAAGTALGEGATTVNVTVAFGEGVRDAAETVPTTANLDTASNKKMSLDLSAWVRANQTNKGKTFTVTYYAKVNKDAVVTNNNKASLEYGNNPDNTTNTTPSEVKTPTYPLDILKVKKDSDPKVILADAHFTLYASTTEGNIDENNPIKVTKDAEGKYSYAADQNAADATDDMVTVASKIDGQEYNLHINGLAAGTYYLKETKAPEGYNKLTAPIKVTIEKSTDVADANQWTLKDADGKKIDSKIVTIENSTGSLLPSTGGMGTIIFAVIAAILVLGVAVSFIRDKRKNA